MGQRETLFGYPITQANECGNFYYFSLAQGSKRRWPFCQEAVIDYKATFEDSMIASSTQIQNGAEDEGCDLRQAIRKWRN